MKKVFICLMVFFLASNLSIAFGNDTKGDPSWGLVNGETNTPRIIVLSFYCGANGKKKNEMLEVKAKLPINLSGGVIGDLKNRIKLPNDKKLNLQPEDSVKIFINDNFLDADDAISIVLKNDDGIWKQKKKKEDRVMLKDSSGNIVLDFTYVVKK